MDLNVNIEASAYGVRVGSYVGFLLGMLGLFAWVVGQPLLIPSVGPAAFVLATLPEEELSLPQRVIAGQFIGATVAVHELVGRRLDIWDLPYPSERTGDK